MCMITIFVDKLSKEKTKKIKKAIISYGARIVEQGKKDEISFECSDDETKKLICKEIIRIKKE